MNSKEKRQENPYRRSFYEVIYISNKAFNIDSSLQSRNNNFNETFNNDSSSLKKKT